MRKNSRNNRSQGTTILKQPAQKKMRDLTAYINQEIHENFDEKIK